MGLANVRGARWLLLIAVVVVAAFVVAHRAQPGAQARGWDVFGTQGEFTPGASRTSLMAQAPYLLRIPRSLYGLRYAGAMTHFGGASTAAFVELLYGSPKGPFADLAESRSSIGVDQLTTRLVVAGHTFQVGRSSLGGLRRPVALGRLHGTYVLVVISSGAPRWPAVLAPLVRRP